MNIWKKRYAEDYRNHYYESLLKSKLNPSHEKTNILGHLVEHLQLKVSHKIFPGWFFPDWIGTRRATTQSQVDNKRCSDDRKEGSHGVYIKWLREFHSQVIWIWFTGTRECEEFSEHSSELFFWEKSSPIRILGPRINFLSPNLSFANKKVIKTWLFNI